MSEKVIRSNIINYLHKNTYNTHKSFENNFAGNRQLCRIKFNIIKNEGILKSININLYPSFTSVYFYVFVHFIQLFWLSIALYIKVNTNSYLFFEKRGFQMSCQYKTVRIFKYSVGMSLNKRKNGCVLVWQRKNSFSKLDSGMKLRLEAVKWGTKLQTRVMNV